MTLIARCRELVQRYGIRAKIDGSTLGNYYKDAKIKYCCPQRSLATSLSEADLRERRVDFLKQLLRHIHNG